MLHFGYNGSSLRDSVAPDSQSKEDVGSEVPMVS